MIDIKDNEIYTNILYDLYELHTYELNGESAHGIISGEIRASQNYEIDAFNAVHSIIEQYCNVFDIAVLDLPKSMVFSENVYEKVYFCPSYNKTKPLYIPSGIKRNVLIVMSGDDSEFKHKRSYVNRIEDLLSVTVSLVLHTK